MKIACIGNMNNAFFSLTRYLRDQGLDAHLLTLSSEPVHFSPEADSYTDEYKKYTHALNWSRLPTTFSLTKKKDILDAIKGYDFIIACDAAPAYLARVGRKVDLFIPYGSDIHTLPHFNLFDVPWQRAHRYYQISKYQRKAIKNTRIMSLESTNPEFETQFVNTVPMDGRRLNVTCPFIYYPQYENGEMEAYAGKSDLFARFKNVREAHDLVVFQHSRQEWIENGGLEVAPHVWSKGNDKLIRGFASFTKNYPQVKSALILFEYGGCVNKSKELIDKLGIKSKVSWFPISYRKDIMLCISMIDVGVGELGISWFSYGTILEFMALRKPVMHFRDDRAYAEKILYPMINASTDEQVFEGIVNIYSSKKESADIGDGGYHWLKENAIEKPLQEYIALIKGKNP